MLSNSLGAADPSSLVWCCQSFFSWMRASSKILLPCSCKSFFFSMVLDSSFFKTIFFPFSFFLEHNPTFCPHTRCTLLFSLSKTSFLNILHIIILLTHQLGYDTSLIQKSFFFPLNHAVSPSFLNATSLFVYITTWNGQNIFLSIPSLSFIFLFFQMQIKYLSNHSLQVSFPTLILFPMWIESAPWKGRLSFFPKEAKLSIDKSPYKIPNLIG